jgi:HAD superfamily hydrolase (TIGR01450 family)
MDINSSRGMSHGMTLEKLSAVDRFRESPLFSEAERAALAFAEAASRVPTAVTEGEFEPLRRHFTVPQIVELAATIAIEHFRAKFNTALGVQSQGLCFPAAPRLIALGSLRGFAFDLDGCIWAGSTLLPGARDLVLALRAAGRGVVFVTNSSRERAAQIAERLSRLGIPARAPDVLAALDLLGEAIRRRQGPQAVLPLGTREMGEVLEAAGHSVVAFDDWRRAGVVAVGNDPLFDFGRLRAASRAVAGGAALFTVNLDPRLPVAPGEFDPGCGALCEAVAVAGGARPEVVGKPHAPIFEMALERLGCAPAEAMMVGDGLPTDIAGGRAAGMATAWLDPEERGGGQADLVVPDLARLLEAWTAARA